MIIIVRSYMDKIALHEEDHTNEHNETGGIVYVALVVDHLFIKDGWGVMAAADITGITWRLSLTVWCPPPYTQTVSKPRWFKQTTYFSFMSQRLHV